MKKIFIIAACSLSAASCTKQAEEFSNEIIVTSNECFCKAKFYHAADSSFAASALLDCSQSGGSILRLNLSAGKYIYKAESPSTGGVWGGFTKGNYQQNLIINF